MKSKLFALLIGLIFVFPILSHAVPRTVLAELCTSTGG